MTTVLLRELLKDYIAGKLSLDMQCDFDVALKAICTPLDRRIILLYAMGYSPSEVAEKISASSTRVEQELRILLMLLSEYLQISDMILYRRVKKEKHGQLRSFLVFANQEYGSLEEIVELWRQK